ncbi:hypothetical protein QMG61_11445 [Cryobacterium sp. PH31-AA6]|uniref:hypothetical protein n=1 Tax=Cryobacterium sp. PH31-AA6 TaxID=3046205 RepID=UPI0024B928B1|nr:hypothetical protein [Cryobacterium sp. PH31-AA6]MDJ0324376.1 hypothetical protein [Cryobacterium sp. PH31-AA6]
MNTPTIVASSDAAAAARFVDVFAAADFAGDVGPRMTCTEVDALAGMHRAVGADTAANTWVTAHAAEDHEGDDHHQA